jgi:hypothetical protein
MCWHNNRHVFASSHWVVLNPFRPHPCILLYYPTEFVNKFKKNFQMNMWIWKLHNLQTHEGGYYNELFKWWIYILMFSTSCSLEIYTRYFSSSHCQTIFNLKMIAIWDIMPYSIEVNRHFRGVHCLPGDGELRTSETSVYFTESTWRYIPEGYIIILLATMRMWNLS